MEKSLPLSYINYLLVQFIGMWGSRKRSVICSRANKKEKTLLNLFASTFSKGFNDNGSGMLAMMETARILSKVRFFKIMCTLRSLW